ncbi:DUF3445 domain-containing protein, partial [Octadecabacter sp.]|nr:DUF3445 domain-containing protein [Octadecabacter sp.]
YRDTRKINPNLGATLGDGTPNDNDRVEIGPSQLAFDEWEAAGLTLPNLQNMRNYRWKRLTQHIVDRGYGGLLMFDPLNIRYATDSTNMQLWNTHNPFRAVLLCADGYMVIWDYKIAPFLSEFNPLVRERRSGASMFYFAKGDKVDPAAQTFVQEVKDLIAEHGGANPRLAVDKIMVPGYRALIAAGFDGVQDGKPMWRANALRYHDAALHQPRRENDPRPVGAPDAPYLRSERQTVLRLPQSGAVAFMIHTTVVKAD